LRHPSGYCIAGSVSVVGISRGLGIFAPVSVVKCRPGLPTL
jgi:hypothetical protein